MTNYQQTSKLLLLIISGSLIFTDRRAYVFQTLISDYGDLKFGHRAKRWFFNFLFPWKSRVFKLCLAPEVGKSKITAVSEETQTASAVTRCTKEGLLQNELDVRCEAGHSAVWGSSYQNQKQRKLPTNTLFEIGLSQIKNQTTRIILPKLLILP